MSTIANLAIGITARTTGLRRGLGKATSMVRGFGRSITGLVGSLTGLGTLLTAGGIIAGLSKMTALANTQYIAERKLSGVIRATGGAAALSAKEIKKFASARQELTNFGDEATIAAASVLATFKAIKGPMFKDALVAIQDISAEMGTNLQAQTLQVGTALNNPIKGLARLTKVGITFTDQQRDQIKALQESGDMMGAQGVIMRELQSEYGGLAEALADPVKQMWNTLGDLGETLGGQLLPFVRLLAGDANEAFSQVNKGAATSVGSVGLLGEGLLFLVDAAQEVAKAWVATNIEINKGIRWGLKAITFGDKTNSPVIDELDNMIRGMEKRLDSWAAGDSWSQTLRKRVLAEKAKMAADLDAPALGKLHDLDVAGTDGAALGAGSTRNFAGAQVRGSAGAYSAEMRLRFGRQQADIAKRQLEEEKKQTKVLEKILEVQHQQPVGPDVVYAL